MKSSALKKASRLKVESQNISGICPFCVHSIKFWSGDMLHLAEDIDFESQKPEKFFGKYVVNNEW